MYAFLSRLLVTVPFWLFFSPYTHAETFVYVSAAADKRIQILKLNPTTGELIQIDKVTTPGEPGALITTPDKRFLLAAIRAEGRLASFRIDQRTGALTPISVIAAGADPAHIATDSTGRFLYTAYYVAGKVSVHGIGQYGVLSDQPLQELPTTEKAHAVSFDHEKSLAYVPHTGPNRIYVFRHNPENGRLNSIDPPYISTPENSGPRHVAWHPKLPVAYIDNEQGSSVTSYIRDKTTGRLEAAVTASTIPANFERSNSCAEIKIHPSGRFGYVANRGHDSIAGFKINSGGDAIMPLGQTPTEATPRSFDIDPSGKYVMVAGETSGHLSVYQVDEFNGSLSRLQRYPLAPRLWWVMAIDLP